ncbi:MAG: fumarate hydratase C-terminal domain-containing protein [Lachnospiraceae bacterium]|nr:fumarate hydratase C-terminal domain-containing protein [Lachnospiraceae bacterium]
MDHHINLPFTQEDLEKIQHMDVLYLTGTVYTARDAAHKRMYEFILQELENSSGSSELSLSIDPAVRENPKSFDSNDRDSLKSIDTDVRERIISGLPFDIRGAVVYYLGPTPARPGQVIGSAGPTTSGRMDRYTPLLLDLGLKGLIGKGRRSDAVIESIHKNKAIYMGATGGAGALLSKCIKSSEVVAYEDLGTEAVRKLYVENFPVTVLEK